MDITKIQISTKDKEMKEKIINILSKELNVNKVSKTYNDGSYQRIYLNISNGGGINES
ncbi:hypothetical protein [Clostridium beijerinckii]|uniref:hypothetical protein n=1 Tax=Clostridium beijerinckii TaxID=1520 RepID=UPI00031EB26C|nr:hypothetical protein [Clostridium beijerinckii]